MNRSEYNDRESLHFKLLAVFIFLLSMVGGFYLLPTAEDYKYQTLIDIAPTSIEQTLTQGFLTLGERDAIHINENTKAQDFSDVDAVHYQLFLSFQHPQSVQKTDVVLEVNHRAKNIHVKLSGLIPFSPIKFEESDANTTTVLEDVRADWSGRITFDQPISKTTPVFCLKELSGFDLCHPIIHGGGDVS